MAKKRYPQFIPSIYKDSQDDVLNIKKLDSYERNNLKEDTVKCFSYNNEMNNEIHEEFSILTHHKSRFISNIFLPILTLGTVLKNEKSEYLICIQQKCDSVRIDKNRNFLFLPLDVVYGNGSFDFLSKEDNEYIKLKIINNSYQLKVIEFKATDRGIVEAQKNDFKLYFNGSDRSQYLWLFDLKESHAQKISNEYAATLSRVGIDQSEWLRRN
jgi:hypothetical protein